MTMRFFQFLLFLAPTLLMAQHTIQGTYSPQEEFNFNFLYQVTADNPVYKMMGQNEGNGKYTFTLDSTITKGFYKIVYGVPMEEKSFYILYDDKNDISYEFNKETGITFKDQQNKILYNFLEERKNFLLELNTLFSNKDTPFSAVTSLLEKQKAAQQKSSKKSKNLYVEQFITALNISLPNQVASTNGLKEYFKNSFFNNFDFSNAALQASSFPLLLLQDYYTLLATENNKEILDKIIYQFRKETEEFQIHVLYDFWTWLEENNQDGETFYLASYLSPIAQNLNNIVAFEKLEGYMRLAIGIKAPNFILNEEQTLYQLNNAEYYVLAFWNSRCAHCLEQIPELHWNMQRRSNKIKTIAIGLEEDNLKWKEEIEKTPDFIHTMVMEEEKYKMKREYVVYRTPTYFVLDAEKRFIYKPKNLEELLEWLDKQGL